jgi:hypothetical protein
MAAKYYYDYYHSIAQYIIEIAAVDRFKPIICWLCTSIDGLLFDIFDGNLSVHDRWQFEKFKAQMIIADCESQGHISSLE